MAARVETFPLPHRSGRRLFKPVLVWAFVAALAAIVRRAARQPSLPRMSDQWLLSHQRDFDRNDHP